MPLAPFTKETRAFGIKAKAAKSQVFQHKSLTVEHRNDTNNACQKDDDSNVDDDDASVVVVAALCSNCMWQCHKQQRTFLLMVCLAACFVPCIAAAAVGTLLSTS